MIGISLTFLAGRYHATPWGRHVNEAVPEWPPSPWRLLRTLVATWKRKASDLSRGEVEPILRALAKPPQFRLPPATVGHTRHYMPWFKKGPDDPTLVFDAFVAVPRETQLVALWPDVELDKQQQDGLAVLLHRLGFLGRAESWCEATLLTPDATAHFKPNSYPASRYGVPDSHEIVRTLCADLATAFNDDHVVIEEIRSTGRGKNKIVETVRRPLYDPNWNLCMETLQLHTEKWSDPPGSQWVSYTRPKDCFEVRPRRVVTAKHSPRPQVARFALDSSVLPLVTETLPIAELARRALMGIYGWLTMRPDGTSGRSPTFSGKDASGNKRLSPHLHAFYLPTDEDGDGRLDHLTVGAEEGFGADELKALDLLTLLSGAGRDASSHPLRMLLVGLGRLDAFDIGPSAQSRVWISTTPFIAPRHPKRRGQSHDDPRFWRRRTATELRQLREQGKPTSEYVFAYPVGWLEVVLREELVRFVNRRPDLEDISPERIEIHPLLEAGVFRVGNRGLRPIQFKRSRQKHGDDGAQRFAGAFKIKFPREVHGPITLGHSAHFGLGLFGKLDEV